MGPSFRWGPFCVVFSDARSAKMRVVLLLAEPCCRNSCLFVSLENGVLK